MKSIIKRSLQLFDDDLSFYSFPTKDKVAVTHKDIKDKVLYFPINTPLTFSVNDIKEELKRFTSFEKYIPFISTKYRNRRFVIYHNNPTLTALIEYIITLNNYKSYHIFCCGIDSYNAFQYLDKKYNNVRVNTVEIHLSSMLRIIRNEYEDYYNDSDHYNDDVIIFFSKNNSLQEICCVLDWNKDCYISLPYNSFLILMLKHFYRYYCKFDVISICNGYCILRVFRNKYRYSSTNMIVEKVKKYWNEKLKKILFPMYYM